MSLAMPLTAKYFNSRPREGGDDRAQLVDRHVAGISIPAPAKGATTT